MSSAIVKYDSRNKKYKRPFGAVTSGTEVFLSVEIRTDYVVRRVNAVVLYDRHKAPAIYEMHRAGSCDLYAEYRTSVVFQDTGLYWYHFEIETDLGKLIVGRCEEDDSPVVIDPAFSDEEPVPWQQTIYLREYKEPEWIYGGVFYHIFVDRFAKGVLKSVAEECHAEEYDADGSGYGTEDGGTGNEDDGYAHGENAYEKRLREHYERAGKILRDDWGGMPAFRPNEEGRIINNDFFGGNLAGVIEKLPYLSDLGVTCLYLSPIFEAFSNHKYDTANYLNIAPEFGTEEDLSELCEKAAERGIRVILDGVFAHTGADSVYFNKYRTYGDGGAWNDPYSPYRTWYMIEQDGEYDSWWGIDTLPKVNKEDPSYVDFMTGDDGVVRHWLRKGAAGWRLDVADELPVSFLTALSRAVHEEKRDALLIGEVWEDASNKVAYDERKNYFEGDKLDSVMDYPLKDAIISFVREGDARALALTAERITENYPSFAVNSLMNNLGTHDSIRIMTALAGKKIKPCLETREEQAANVLSGEEYEEGIRLMKAAVLLQMTLPGVPCIYYGDEAGMQGYSDPFNRACYPWGNENDELLEWYRRLIKIRRENQVYAKGAYRTLMADDGLYAFVRMADADIGMKKLVLGLEREENANALVPELRRDEAVAEENSHEIITVVNRSGKKRTLEVEGSWKDLIAGAVYHDQITLKSDEMVLLRKTCSHAAE